MEKKREGGDETKALYALARSETAGRDIFVLRLRLRNQSISQPSKSIIIDGRHRHQPIRTSQRYLFLCERIISSSNIPLPITVMDPPPVPDSSSTEPLSSQTIDGPSRSQSFSSQKSNDSHTAAEYVTIILLQSEGKDILLTEFADLLAASFN